MSSDRRNSKFCSEDVSLLEHSVRGVNERGGEKESLPRRPSVLKGKSKKLLPRSSKRRVQWNDRHGKKLVQVLEFEPSGSDSDDDFLDTCICTVM